MFKVVLRQFLRTWDKGLIYIATFVLCSLCALALIIPINLFRQEIDKKSNMISMAYYLFKCEGFSGSELNSLEEKIKSIDSDPLVFPSAEYEISYKNFNGAGRAMTLSDAWFEKLDKSYNDVRNTFIKLCSGRIPANENEVLVLGFLPYSSYSYSQNEEKIEKTVVLPGTGECECTGTVNFREEWDGMIVDMQGGVIVSQTEFGIISNGKRVNLFVMFQKTLNSDQEIKLKQTVSEYADVIEASCVRHEYDDEADKAELNLAVELSAILLFAVSACLIFVQSDLLEGNMTICGIMKQIGMTERKCFLFNLALMNIYMLIAEVLLCLVLRLSEISDWFRFIYPGKPDLKWIVVLSAYLIGLLIYIAVYLKIRHRKEKIER